MTGDMAMSYGHAERNLALIRHLEAETSRMLASFDQPIPEQQAGPQESAAAAAGERHPGPQPVTPFARSTAAIPITAGSSPSVARDRVVRDSQPGAAVDVPGGAVAGGGVSCGGAGVLARAITSRSW